MKVAPFEQEFTDFFVRTMKSFGLDTLSAKIVSILFIEPDEVSMEELAKRTGYSLSSLCNKLHMLETAGQVRRRKHPGTKRVFYYMEKDLIKLLEGKLKTMIELYLNPALEAVPRITERYKNTNLSGDDRKKMAILINYQKQLVKMKKMTHQMTKYLEKTR